MTDLVDADDLVRAWDEHADRADFRGNGPTFTAREVRNWLVTYSRTRRRPAPRVQVPRGRR